MIFGVLVLAGNFCFGGVFFGGVVFWGWCFGGGGGRW